MNHFGDLSGLLSELAAVGFERFAATMQANLREDDPPARRMDKIGHGYVAFARAHPGLFLLMFRSERLDMSRPALRAAVDASAQVLAGAVAARREERVEASLTLPQAASIVAAWSLVHGFADARRWMAACSRCWRDCRPATAQTRCWKAIFTAAKAMPPR